MEVEVAEGYVLIRAGDQLDAEVIDEAIQRLRRNPLISASTPTLLDLRSVSHLALDVEAIRGYSQQFNPTDNLKLVIVASDDLIFGMARLFQSELRSDRVQCKIFQDFYLALSWVRH